MIINKRIFVEKKEKFNTTSYELMKDLNGAFDLHLQKVRIVQIYDCFNVTETLVSKLCDQVLKEIATDSVFFELDLEQKSYIAVEFLPDFKKPFNEVPGLFV